jgi:NAD(P)-dependent dehydrogenase (short-subunit alcohol dehydrogenase family)
VVADSRGLAAVGIPRRRSHSGFGFDEREAQQRSLAAYSASKFALLGLCQTMRNEGWAAGIRVTAICPGWVNTDMAAAVRSGPSDRWPTQPMDAEAMTQPEDIASMSAELLRLPNRAVPF